MVFADTPQVETATPKEKLTFFQAAFQKMLKSPGTN
jgi:hypothetical protein